MARRRLSAFLVLAAFAAQLFCAPSALAQSLTGRAYGSAPGGAVETARRAPTVESASREAQAAIRECDDRVAIECVAGVLTRYAAALQEIADRRRLAPRNPSRNSP